MNERGLTLASLLRELEVGTELQGNAEVHVLGVHEDSRAIAPGDLFVLRKGAQSDGQNYVRDALSRGAVAILTGRDTALTVAVPVIRVDDVPRALAFAAAAVYGHPTFSLDVVGITGTNGKTTTTQLLRRAIDHAEGRAACGVLGTVGIRFGELELPSTHTTPGADEVARVAARMRELGAKYLAMEVSSHALIQERVRAVRFRVAAFTNLTQDHLDFHGTMDAYREAKAKLFFDLSPGYAVINVVDPTGRQFADAFEAGACGPLLRVSARPEISADVHVTAFESDAEGIRATFHTPTGVYPFATRMLGEHNLENITVALGVAHALELDLGLALTGMAQERGVAGRLQRVDEPTDDVIVVVDYAHTPDALERVLSTLSRIKHGKLWCVFGCGGDRDRKKRPLMGAAAGGLADRVIVTNDNPRTEDGVAIAAEIEPGLHAQNRIKCTLQKLANTEQGYAVELDRQRAIAFAVRAAAPGDIVLIAGKGHEDYQIIGDQKFAFDDCEEGRHALRERASAALKL